MPLIDLKTDLKSLRFGRDRKGGGNSGQPYIKTNIPETPFEEAITSPLGVKDFLLRGGLNAITDTAEDVLRLGKMFLNPKNPSGLLFTAKQNLLSRTAVRTQTSGILNEGVYTPLSTLAQAGVNAFGGHLNKQGINPFELTGAYSNNPNLYGVKVKSTQPNSLNRLVRLKDLVDEGKSRTFGDGEIYNQGGSTGVNILSYGGGPGSDLGIGRTNIRYADQRTGDQNALVSINPGYFYGTPGKQGFRDFKPGNYLASLSQNYLNFTNVGGAIGSVPEVNPSFKANTASKLYEKQTLTQVNINSFSPDGKPLYTTDVYIDKDISKTNKDLAFKPKDGNATLTQQQVLTQILSRNSGTQVQDFRKEITADSVGTEAYNIARKNGTLTDAPDYSNPNVRFEGRVNLGDPGRKGLDRSNYTKGALKEDGTPNVVDQINALYMYNAETVTTSTSKNDFVKFRFAVINPDQPKDKTFIHFRAIFDGAISDNMSANWDSFKYLGRAEEFYNYTGFSRDISFGFTVVAQSKPELSLMYQKLNYLQSSLTPNYNSTDGFMRGNIHQLTIGGYFYEQPGVITTLNYTMPGDSTWEIGIPSDFENSETAPDNSGIKGDPSVKELTHRIEVSIGFKPIHTFLPQIVGSAFDRTNNPKGVFGKGDIKQRYIALANDGDTGNGNDLYAKGTEYRTEDNGKIPYLKNNNG